MEKALNKKLFVSLSGVVVREVRIEPQVRGSSPAHSFLSSFFFYPVFVLLFFFKYIPKYS